MSAAGCEAGSGPLKAALLPPAQVITLVLRLAEMSAHRLPARMAWPVSGWCRQMASSS
jgi:hypothetical protein